MISTQRAIFVDFPTEIGRSQNSPFLFLNIARRPLTTQGDVNLSSWTFLELLAFLAVQTSSELPGRMPYWPCRHQEVRSTWSTPADDSYSNCFYLLQSMRRCRRRWVCVANSIPASCFFRSKDRAWQELKWRYWWISTEIGRTQNSHFLFLNMARRPRTTQSDLGKGFGESSIFYARFASTWSSLADDSYLSSIYLFQSMWHYRRRCV